MGIYIKGMEMPQNCLRCDVNESYDYCPILRRDTSNMRYDKRFDDCPIVEVKEPHGRLIDADDFEERVRIAGGFSEKEMTEDFEAGILTVLTMLKTQQTVIEAEGGD